MRAVLAIDLEPDDRAPQRGHPADWSGTEALLGGADELRAQLATPVINWFLRIDDQVEQLHGCDHWAAARFAGSLDALAASGDEVGVHPHAWRLDGDRWVADGSEAWALENAQRALEGYRTVFGVYPPSFRYGDRYVSSAVVALLLEHPDVRVDLTTEPGAPTVRALAEGYRTVGVLRHVDPNRSHRYHPASDDLEIEVADASLTMVPLTTAVVPGSNEVDTLQLWRAPDQFADMLELRLTDPGLDHLAFAIRSDIANAPVAFDHAVANVEHLRRTVPDLVWVRASELALAEGERAAPALGPVGTLVHRDALRAAQLEQGRERLGVVEVEFAALEQRVAVLESGVAEANSAAADAAAVATGLGTQLSAVEATITWRLRNRLLPVIRPASRGVRSLRSRFRR